MQPIIESTDKQLTFNEIYNWFQNTLLFSSKDSNMEKYGAAQTVSPQMYHEGGEHERHSMGGVCSGILLA
jgi:hypothetical protein